jgi:hypothetical protein
MIVPDKNEVWFSCDSSVLSRDDEYVGQTGSAPPRARVSRAWPYTQTACRMVYNYEHGKWSINKVNGEELFYQYSNGKPFGIQSFVCYPYDQGDWHWSELMKLESPWIKINQLQDFGRMYSLTILGRYLSDFADTHAAGVEAGDLQVTLKYDYEEDPSADTDVYTFTANQDLLKENGDRLQLRIRPKRQKCQAIKLVIEETATTKIELHEPTYTTGRGFEITAVDVEYGYKGGSSRDFGGTRRKG